MDRIVNPVTVAASRSERYEGRARRLSAGDAAATDFRSLVSEPSSEPPAVSESGPQVSGWAGLVTAGRTGPSGTETQAAAALTSPDAAAEAAPTLEDVFGANPWMASPAGQGPLGVYYYNPVYFATPQTAEKVAQMLGGTVVQQNAFCSAPGSPFQQLQPNYMVKLPNGRVTNPGLVATYYMRGYPQSFIDRLLSIEKNETA